jgi:hypothetical protein
MDYAQTGLLVALLSLQIWTLAQARRGGGLTRRARRRDEYAARAAAYAKVRGGGREVQLAHALETFRALDEADNGKRDYADKEARLAIEPLL